MCRQALEERATSGGGVSEVNVPDQTIGHNSSAGCWGQRAVVTAAHYNYEYDWLRPTLEEIVAAFQILLRQFLSAWSYTRRHTAFPA